MNTTTFIVIGLILALTLNVGIKLNLCYNILINQGCLLLKVFNITIFKRDITLYGNYFTLTNKKNNVIKVKISLKDNSVQFVQDIIKTIKRKVYLQSCNFSSCINLNNAYATALAIGYVQTISGIVLSKLSSRNTDATILHNVNCDSSTNFTLNLKITIYLCLYDFIWSVFGAIYKRRVRIYGKWYR